MPAFRLSDRRLFIPGVGIIPYIRFLRLNNKSGRQYLVVRGKQVTHYFGIYNDNGLEPLKLALETLEKEHGVIRTGNALRKRERRDKQNPTGMVGVYKKSGYYPYHVTCPYETKEDVRSLATAYLVRQQAEQEYERKNVLTPGQVLRQASSL